MATTSPVVVTFEHILVPTDFSEVSQRALEYAKTLAKRENAELLLVHVDPPINPLTPPEAVWIDDAEIQVKQAEQLEQSGAALISEGYKAKAISLSGPLYDELLHAIEIYKVDLIVLGTHGRKGLDRFLLGSNAEAMLRRARCPVLSVGTGVPALEDKNWSIREVLCATTFDPRSAEVAVYAHKLAAEHGAELVFFHVKRPGTHNDVDWVSFEEALRRYAPEGVGTHSWLRTRVASVTPGTSIVDLARQRHSDLIVMGAHPASSLATHFGPGIAAKVLMEAPCPVMTLLQL
jgi:nucleotide-binding universal stress UspA family protein